MKLKRLSPEEFESLVSTTRFENQARLILRAVLVDGRAQADVATEYGVTKQRVHRLVGFFKQDYIENAAIGTALVGVAMEMPENLALEFAGFLDSLKTCSNEDARAEALEKTRNAIRKATKLLNSQKAAAE